MTLYSVLILAVAGLSCSDPTFYCQHNPPKTPLVYSVLPDISQVEEETFLRAAGHWKDWVGAEIRLDRSLPIASPRLTKVLPESENWFDGITMPITGYQLYAVEEETDIWFVRSRISDADLEIVLTHEIGHALGLGHVSERGSLMFKDPKEFNGLSEIDHKDIKVCYLDKQ